MYVNASKSNFEYGFRLGSIWSIPLVVIGIGLIASVPAILAFVLETVRVTVGLISAAIHYASDNLVLWTRGENYASVSRQEVMQDLKLGIQLSNLFFDHSPVYMLDSLNSFCFGTLQSLWAKVKTQIETVIINEANPKQAR
jgi:hypothetical protein